MPSQNFSDPRPEDEFCPLGENVLLKKRKEKEREKEEEKEEESTFPS